MTAIAIAAVRQAVLKPPSLRKLDEYEDVLEASNNPPKTRDMQVLQAWNKKAKRLEESKKAALAELDSFIEQLKKARLELKGRW